MNNYDDIILLRYEKIKHHRMPLEQRSAIFAPFDALEGYSDGIEEIQRMTFDKVTIDENLKEIINSKLNIIKNSNDIEVVIKYFKKDERKKGGSYKTKSGYIKKIDIYNQVIVMSDNTKISINDLIDINIS